jgi:hypothetical protein
VKEQKDIPRITAFEIMLPMKRVQIKQWEQAVKGASAESDSVTAEALIASLKSLEEASWGKGILSKKGLFYSILQDCSSLRIEEDSGAENSKLSKSSLLAWGLLYCKGDR